VKYTMFLVSLVKGLGA